MYNKGTGNRKKIKNMKIKPHKISAKCCDGAQHTHIFYAAKKMLQNKRRKTMTQTKINEAFKKLKELRQSRETTPQQYAELKSSVQGLESPELHLSILISYLQLKDLIEYNTRAENKHYFLSNWFKREMIVSSARQNKMTASFKVDITAAKTLLGCAFLTTDGAINFVVKPLDKETALIKYQIHPDKMNNGLIRMYNTEYDLNIPMNEEADELSDEERVEMDVFTKEYLCLK